MIKNMRHSI